MKPHVSYLNRYWLTVEACSVYAQAAAIVSLEQHSPIMGIAAGVPSVLLRQPTDTRKGQMWYDLRMNNWVFVKGLVLTIDNEGRGHPGRAPASGDADDEGVDSPTAVDGQRQLRLAPDQRQSPR